MRLTNLGKITYRATRKSTVGYLNCWVSRQVTAVLDDLNVTNQSNFQAIAVTLGYPKHFLSGW